MYNELININIRKNKSIKLFGSPISWYRKKPSCAFQVHQEESINNTWNYDTRNINNKYKCKNYINKYFPNINNKIDILITHGPCKNYGDGYENGYGNGSISLYNYIECLKPKYMICSDSHELLLCAVHACVHISCLCCQLSQSCI